MAQDLYETLGISRSATADDIKKAYRNLAFKYHPDRNPGDRAAEEKFKAINAAYDVLGDATKKAQYDRYGTAGNPFESSGAYNHYRNGYSQQFADEDAFWSFFSGMNGAGSTGESNRRHYTYTWTTRPEQRSSSKSELFSLLLIKAIQSLCALFLLPYTFLVIPIGPILGISVLINGLSGIGRAVSGLLRSDKKNGT
ncbi:MAG: DnaJ domain-containing protein [Treponema sp.]|nr:DnaJ domain-containing protein [Treponema sp.]